MRFSVVAWSVITAEPSSLGRAQAFSALFPSGGTVEFVHQTEGVIRTVAFGPWSAGISNGEAFAQPGVFTDPATGEGDWFDAVWKDDAGVEHMRCTAGVGTAEWSMLAPLVDGVPVARGPFGIRFPARPGETPAQAPLAIVGTIGPEITINAGESFSLAPYVTDGAPPYSYSLTSGALNDGVTLNAQTGLLHAALSAISSLSGDLKFRAADSAVSAPVNTTPPVVSGIPEVGAVLSTTAGSWTGGQATYEFQWLRNGALIPGEIQQTYTLAIEDVGAYIAARVTARFADGTSTSVTSDAVGPVTENTTSAEPVNTALPEIAGTLKVGRMLLCSAGSWLQDPDSFAFQWHRDGADISGETSAFYWLAAADEGADIGCRVIASNAFGPSLPAEATTVGPIGPADVVTPGALPEFGLVAEASGLDRPFSFAHPFAKGDVPAGKTVSPVSGLTSFQCVPISTWPDGSLRLAWLSGHASLSAGAVAKFPLQVDDAAPSAALGLAALRAALTSGSITITIPDPAVNLTIDLPTLIAGAPFDVFGNGSGAIFTGPECSAWAWKTRIAGAAHLELWVPIRYYSSGAIEINLPWLQNGDFLTASPRHYAGVTLALTLNGSQRFSATFEAKNKRIVPLVTGNMGADRSYWYDTNPKIRPVHDTQYLQSTKMVPNYRAVPPTESTLNELINVYTPNMLGEILADASRPTVHSVGVLPRWCALHLTSGADKRAFDNVMLNALCGSVRPVHYRDESTGRYISFTQYPKACLDPQATPIVPKGALYGSSGSYSASYPDSDLGHQPSYGFYPWMLTGDLYFLETQQAFATWNYLYSNWGYRRSEKGVFTTAIQDRGQAWGFRTLAQLCVSLPDSHALRADFLASLGHNVQYFSEFMEGGPIKEQGYSVANALGVMSRSVVLSSLYYATRDVGYGNNWHTAPWQLSMQTLAMHHAKSMEPAITNAALLDTVFAWSAQRCIAVTGQNGSIWPYTRFGPYTFPIISERGGIDVPGAHFFSTFSECWTAYAADVSLNNPDILSENLSPAPGGIIRVGFSATPMDASDFSMQSQVAIPLAALACAVEEELPGAAAGWNLVNGAANFTTSGMNYYPMWAFYPRNL